MSLTELEERAAGKQAGAQPAPTQTSPLKGTWFIGELGTYLVGRGIPAGTYESAGAIGGGTCQWTRLKGGNAAVLASGSATGRTKVTIQKTDGFFATQDCANWQRIS